MTDSNESAPEGLTELLRVANQLERLIEPLESLLDMKKAPGLSEWMDSFLFELGAISREMAKIADRIEQVLIPQEAAQEHMARMEQQLAQINQDLAVIKAYLTLPPEAVPTS